jgi:hypothetical protein
MEQHDTLGLDLRGSRRARVGHDQPNDSSRDYPYAATGDHSKKLRYVILKKLMVNAY